MIESSDLPDDMSEEDKTAAIKNTGLYPKYKVFKIGEMVEVTEPVFVLRPNTDPLALSALEAYQSAALSAGYSQLAFDLHTWVQELKMKKLAKALSGDPEIDGYDGFGAPLPAND